MLSVQVAPWPRGGKGAIKSLQKVAEFVSRDRIDPRTNEWAINAVKAAGTPKSDVGKAKAVYDALKKEKIYVLDPVDSEMMKSAVCMLDNCDGITFNGGDCDDLTISYLSAVGTLGIPVAVVGHSYEKSGEIGHVLGAFWDKDSERWIPVDTTIELPFGQTYPPTRERWINIPDGSVICDKGFCYRGMYPPDASKFRTTGDFVGVVDSKMYIQHQKQENFVKDSSSSKGLALFGLSLSVAAITTILVIRGKNV